MSNYWNANKAKDEDPEEKAERERRKKERGKRRYEEDYTHVNEEFFNSWKNRTGGGFGGEDIFGNTDPNSANSNNIETIFNGG